MKKILSFALWGNIKLYCVGAIKNAILAEKIFPDWICRFYYDSSVPKTIIENLQKMKNTEMIFIDIPSGAKKYKQNGQFGMFWKFYPFDDDDVEIWCSRDIDSRISEYEKEIMDEFLKSDKCLHSFRENNEPKLRGGMVSFKNFSKGNDNRIINEKKIIMRNLLERIEKKNTPFYADENFLNNVLFKKFENTYYFSSRYSKGKYTSYKNYQGRYCGDVVDEYDKNINKNPEGSFNKKTDFNDLEKIINDYKKII